MLSYCLKCRKNTESKNPKVARTKNEIIIIIIMCDSKKSKFIKKQDASGLLDKIPLLGPLLF